MAAYATAIPVAQSAETRLAQPEQGSVWVQSQQIPGFDALLVYLADLVAERVAARFAASAPNAEEWLDTRGAAAHLGVHRDTVRRLAAERAIPSEQEGPGCKLFFRRSDLDAWRAGARPLRVLPGGRS
jgi:excisionase family DNA binding protein